MHGVSNMLERLGARSASWTSKRGDTGMATNPKPQEPEKGHHLPEGVHQDDLPWMMQRFPGQTCKMMFHPRPERPTEPNAGLVRYEPGAWHPLHSHDFAQIWYILEGEFLYGDKCFKAGTMIYHPDPHTGGIGTDGRLAERRVIRRPALRSPRRRRPRSPPPPSDRPARRRSAALTPWRRRPASGRAPRGRSARRRGRSGRRSP